MSNHPLHLAARFLLEIALVYIYGYWAWHRFDGVLQHLAVALVPLTGMLLWGIFKVPGDPGKAMVAIPGWLRIMIELLLFGFAFYMLYSLQHKKELFIFASVTCLHYALSFDRIKWLVQQ